MKFYTLLALSLFITFISCSDSDEDTQSTTDMSESEDQMEDATVYSYYSLTTGDNWQYDVTTDDMDTTQDNLEVIGLTEINGTNFTDFESNVDSAGFITNLIAAGGLVESEGTLRYSGEVTIPLDETNNISLLIPEIKLYDQSITTAGTQVDQITQTITQEIEGIPVTIDAFVTSTSGNTIENSSINGVTFPRVLTATLTINATISASILGVQVTLLESQDVIITTNTYAQNIGLVNSDLDFQYEFEDLSSFGVTLPFPESASSFTNQVITTYDVAGDD